VRSEFVMRFVMRKDRFEDLKIEPSGKAFFDLF
jgi:hypothetical protein